jgi:hypothetical protein
MTQRVQRIAITVAGVVATVVLVFGLVAAGFGPRLDPRSVPQAIDSVDDPTLETSTSVQPPPEVETVYVEPVPAPKKVVVWRQRPTSPGAAASTSQRTQAVRYDRGDEDRYEREDSDDREDGFHREDREDDD